MCEMCICLAQGGVEGDGVSELDLSVTNHMGTGGCWTCVCVAVVWEV